jgi:hypothetical protein
MKDHCAIRTENKDLFLTNPKKAINLFKCPDLKNCLKARWFKLKIPKWH